MNDIMPDRKKAVLKGVLNAAAFAFLILFHYSGASIKISYANPMGVLALLVALIIFCSELTGVLTGILVGIVLDSVASTPTGFNTLTLMVLSFAATLISHYLFNKNLKSAIALCFLCSVFYFAARWLVCFAFSGDVAGSFTYLLRYGMGSAIYTTVFAVPFYYFEKKLFNIAR